MTNLPSNQVFFAYAYPDKKKKIGISQGDRRFHQYFLGRTGTGKSTALFSMIIQDTMADRGLCLIDPHGDLAESVLAFVPKKRQKDLVYLNPSDLDYPVGLNVLENVDESERHLVASGLMSIFRKSWADSWGPRMAYLLHNSLLLLLEKPGSTLLSLARLLGDKKFRDRMVRDISDPVVNHYWTKEFSAFPDKLLAEVVSPVQNKIGAYLTNRALRNILGQKRSTIDLEKIVNGNGILIANLSKCRFGEDAANLLGSLLVTRIQLVAAARANIPEEQRRDFMLYADEFQSFTTESFADILAEARKYRLNLILANQYLGQLQQGIRDAVLANVGTIVVFRVGPEDAQVLAKEFGTDWPWSNLVDLNPHEIYYKLMEQGKVGKPRQTATLGPPAGRIARDSEGYKRRLIKLSRRLNTRARKKVEAEIGTFFSNQ